MTTQLAEERLEKNMADLKALKAQLDKKDRVTTEAEQVEWNELVTVDESLKAEIKRNSEYEASLATMPVVTDMAADLPRQTADRRGETTPAKFETFGEQITAIVDASRPQGFGYKLDPRLATINAATGLSEGVPADGGFMVQTDFQEGLMSLLHDTGQVWSRARNIPISSNANGVKINAINETSRANGSRWGGILAYWRAEAAAKTPSAPEFRQIELNLKKLIGLCYATDELLEDAGALESVLMQGFAEEFGFKLDDAAINGTGAGQPVGILTGGSTVTVGKEVGQATATIVYNNIVKMWARLWARSQQNAVWFINQDVQPSLFAMVLTGGTASTPVYMPPGGLSGAPYGTIFGRPVIPIEQCATLGTLGDIILADMSQYITCTKGGVQTASSIHLKFNYDETTFRWVYRADGQPGWSSALIPYKGAANTQSPFVVLEARP